MDSALFTVAFWTIIIFIIFLIIREFNTWYWKINQIVYLLSEQNKLLRKHLDIEEYDTDNQEKEVPQKSYWEKLNRDKHIQTDDSKGKENGNSKPKKSLLEKFKEEEEKLRDKK